MRTVHGAQSRLVPGSAASRRPLRTFKVAGTICSAGAGKPHDWTSLSGKVFRRVFNEEVELVTQKGQAIVVLHAQDAGADRSQDLHASFGWQRCRFPQEPRAALDDGGAISHGNSVKELGLASLLVRQVRETGTRLDRLPHGRRSTRQIGSRADGDFAHDSIQMLPLPSSRSSVADFG